MKTIPNCSCHCVRYQNLFSAFTMLFVLPPHHSVNGEKGLFLLSDEEVKAHSHHLIILLTRFNPRGGFSCEKKFLLFLVSLKSLSARYNWCNSSAHHRLTAVNNSDTCCNTFKLLSPNKSLILQSNNTFCCCLCCSRFAHKFSSQFNSNTLFLSLLICFVQKDFPLLRRRKMWNIFIRRLRKYRLYEMTMKCAEREKFYLKTKMISFYDYASLPSFLCLPWWKKV